MTTETPMKIVTMGDSRPEICRLSGFDIVITAHADPTTEPATPKNRLHIATEVSPVII